MQFYSALSRPRASLRELGGVGDLLFNLELCPNKRRGEGEKMEVNCTGAFSYLVNFLASFFHQKHNVDTLLK